MVGIPAYMITSNGARVYSPDDELMFSCDVPELLVKDLIQVCANDKDITVHIYRHDTWLLSREEKKLREYHNESGFTYQRFDLNNPPLDGISKIFFTHTEQDHEILATYESQLNQHFAGKVTVAFSSPWCLEVMGPNVSKGHALEVIADSLDKSLEHCLAFGDGMNDIEMLSMAGIGLVMGTAHEKVMAALPDIARIGSNADDSVARYLNTHLLSCNECTQTT
jgi:Cof subfamily protein (haloacid dehalogenase superfamily)